MDPLAYRRGRLDCVASEVMSGSGPDDGSFVTKVVAAVVVIFAFYVLLQFGISAALADWLEPALADGFPRIP